MFIVFIYRSDKHVLPALKTPARFSHYGKWQKMLENLKLNFLVPSLLHKLVNFI